uniref:C2H2-type domain-containing protein n=1 Tax=Steinernema glaseri TaxID=37863 RepID=A0A1I7Y049_9BILA
MLDRRPEIIHSKEQNEDRNPVSQPQGDYICRTRTCRCNYYTVDTYTIGQAVTHHSQRRTNNSDAVKVTRDDRSALNE